MSRGITEQDVFDAANAILARSERPTIERVRKELGRGSPNTVNRLLDSWWAGLSNRLNKAPGKLPPELVTACERLFERLLREAQNQAAEGAQQGRTTLACQIVDMQLREQALRDREAGVAASVETLRLELAKVSERNSELVRESTRLAMLNEDLHLNTQHAEERLQTSEMKFSEQAQKHSTELARRHDQAAAQENRWLRQIDALRTDIKTLREEKTVMAKRHGQELSNVNKVLEDSRRSSTKVEKLLSASERRTQSAEVKLAKAEAKVEQAEKLIKAFASSNTKMAKASQSSKGLMSSTLKELVRASTHVQPVLVADLRRKKPVGRRER